MKWLIRIGIVLVVLLVLVVVIGLTLPGTYHVQRSVVIEAGPQTIHQLAGNLIYWPEWMPWQEMDPTIEVELGDATSGVGAHQSWTGKDGHGEVTFTTWDPATGVTYDMSTDFGDCVATIHYEPASGGTRVIWDMKGSLDGLGGGVLALLMDKKMVGPAFEKGLDNLKLEAEAIEPQAEPEAASLAGTADVEPAQPD